MGCNKELKELDINNFFLYYNKALAQALGIFFVLVSLH